MQHNSMFGLPSPPPSPDFDNNKCHGQPNFAPRPFQVSYVPLEPEARLGMLLQGTLRLNRVLGTGAYGVVYAAVDIHTGISYAVKCLSKFNPDGTPLERRQIAYQQREIRLHYLASAHQNVVSMLKIVDDADCTYVILEYCPEGDLFHNITDLGHYVGKDELAKKIFLQILDAVEHCHKLRVFHRDLKPENILVTDHGDTVKLADFGLATGEDRSEDYGCGSTFYMSPECLDHSSRKPFYMCAPNDVWSLGVILVNLTCGRNPWKQASWEDSTYRAFLRSPGFLKTILPITDDLNDILARIFHPNPELRITLSELRTRIMACSGLTVPAMPLSAPLTPPVTPPPEPQMQHDILAPMPQYVCENVTVDDVDDYDSPCSPATTFSDDGSLTSSGSTIEDLDDDFIDEQQEDSQPEYGSYSFEHEEPQGYPYFGGAHEFVPQQYNGPVPVTAPVAPLQPVHCQPVPGPSPQVTPLNYGPSKPKSVFPLLTTFHKYVQQVPAPHPSPFHQQVPFLPSIQGCY